MPVEYLPIILAERFGGGPMLYRDLPADERAELLAILAEEARVNAELEDLGPDDDIVVYDDDLDDEGD